MKIVIVGPLPPYRGGIAHSNYILCRNIAKGNDLTAISFSRLYPKSLYPGKFQEIGAPPEYGFKVESILDAINPLNWIMVSLKIRELNPEQVTLQWWHTFFTPAYFTIAVMAKLLTKAKVSMVVHNALPHESSFLHRILTRIMFSQADFFVALSASDVENIKALKKGAKAGFLQEPAYSDYFAGGNDAKNGLKHRVLFFGFVREYKGLHYLIDAMPAILKELPGMKLDIVGEFWKDKGEYLAQISGLGIGSSVNVIDRYVRDEEVGDIFSGADAVILPYVSSTHTAVVQLAAGFGLPVISTDVGGNRDVIESGKNGILVKPKDSMAIADAVVKFYKKGLWKEFRQEMKSKAGVLGWNREKEAVFFNTK
ncbi:D-inositol-3-phosphate glycosyltransferase [uncultured archaeon]|nr:D-inositol-3-phosphate glycosyltransferase [uncultured archaeon]